MRLMVTVVLVVLTTCTVIHRASGQYIETAPLSTSDTYVMPNNGGTLQFGVDMRDTLVFDRRSRPAIEFGMNWGSWAGSSIATSLFGMSIIDDYPRNMVAGPAHFGTRPARIVAALTGGYSDSRLAGDVAIVHSSLSYGSGFAIRRRAMTSVSDYTLHELESDCSVDYVPWSGKRHCTSASCVACVMILTAQAWPTID
jgi:hypothetical protein